MWWSCELRSGKTVTVNNAVHWNIDITSGNMKKLNNDQLNNLITILRERFEKNMNRHKSVKWSDVQSRLENNDSALWSLSEMECTGGEPDVVAMDPDSGEVIFFDCSPESPGGRRSLCYDREALEARKEAKPAGSAVGMAEELGLELLTEEQYRFLQKTGKYDAKTSSWIKTPASIRKLGGSLFADYRYGNVFVYHNGAQSYYSARGFRGALRV